MLRITQGKGFHIRFDNGWTASVQWGPGNYCDNYSADFHEAGEVGEKGSRTAEVAAWPEGGPLSPIPGEMDGQTVGSHYTSEGVLVFLLKVACQPAVVDTEKEEV